MFYYNNQKYLIISMVLIILFTTTIANAAYKSNYDSKQKANIYSNSIILINLDKTPDEIARGPEGGIIRIIEQSQLNRK